MRSRYYNPDIKRFINQDVLIGSISNSNSLNRYSYVEGNPVSYTDPFGLSPYGNFGTFLTVMKFMSQIDIMSLVHVTLSALGALPGCTWLNFINAGLYLAEQNYAEACKSLLFGLANLDWLTGAAKFAVSIGKYTEDLGLILKGIDLGLHLLACCQSATDFGTIAAGMIDKYLVNGEDVTWKIALEFLTLAGTGVQLGLLTYSLTGKLNDTFGGSSLDGGGVSAVTNSKHVQEVVDDASSSDTKLKMPASSGGNSSVKRINVGKSGHHVPAVRKSKDRPFEVSRNDKTRPTLFSKGNDPGYDHWRLHDAERDFVGPRQGDFLGTDDELFDAYRNAYKGLDDIKVDVKSPNGTYTLGIDVTPYEAVDLMQGWLKDQGLY